jgi:hypothetical protein
MVQSSMFSGEMERIGAVRNLVSRGGRIPFAARQPIRPREVRSGERAGDANLALAAGIVLAAAVRARHPLWVAPAMPAILGSMPRFAENPRNRKQEGWNHFHIAIYLTNVVFAVSQRLTGLAFDRDRTTIRYASARIEDARDDRKLDYALDVLTAALAVHASAISGMPAGDGEIRI